LRPASSSVPPGSKYSSPPPSADCAAHRDAVPTIVSVEMSPLSTTVSREDRRCLDQAS
ncbi:hypothetical protein M9458_036888, partial [Cirrhinus mrigala]